MKLDLTIFELGKLLKKIEDKYDLNMLVKLALSGGWATITGNANVLKYPNDSNCGCNGKDNIIDISVERDGNEHGSVIKITGAKDKKFDIDISSTRYKELRPNNLTVNKIKINENESKLRIDENIIFTIGASVNDIKELIEN
ncbi:hypothetical protein [Clostridium beijerinckii]|uniref:hypothetical protein n=1 Tax=Clostridium beijerinckii TaxID=1520 RepID=UPI00047BDDF9|nr:hypothetical protein [Clostridium beijerinckii]